MDRRLLLFARVWAVLAIALLAASWKLWTPQTCFPQIPFFEFLISVPGWVDWIVLSLVGSSLLACLLLKHSAVQPIAPDQARGWDWFRIAHLLFALAIALLILFDQNRLQPWAYHFAIIGLLIGLATPSTAASLIRWLAISIYIYSAISKFDYQFVHTVGEEMLSTMLGFFGIETTDWPSNLTSSLVLLLPAGELLVGIGLAIPRFRKFAAMAAVGLHLSLLIILGPWGLGHRTGVLLWNLFFIFQALILFWPQATTETAEAKTDRLAVKSSREKSPRQKVRHLDHLALVLAVLVLAFPLTQWIGICDHWPAWQVYSPSSSRAQLVNERSLSQWSLEELGVPVYPQSRFQLAVALAVIEKNSNEQNNRPRSFQIEFRHQSDRVTGNREQEILSRPDQFKMKRSEFWVNTRARKTWFK